MTEYTIVQRSTMIDAAPEAVREQLDDFHRWRDWSPWEGLDPDLRRRYEGPDRGVGAVYSWSGNRKAGAGRMEVRAEAPDAVDIDLLFTKPFKSASAIQFGLRPTDRGTQVVWQMRMTKTLMTRVASVFLNMEKVVGPDLERGLANLKRLLEAP